MCRNIKNKQELSIALRKQVEELQEALDVINVSSAIYHAGLTNKEREVLKMNLYMIK